MKKRCRFLFAVLALFGGLGLQAQVPVRAYQLSVEETVPERPVDWVDFQLKTGLDTVSGEWLALDADPVVVPSYGEPLAVETQPIGFDFLYAGLRKTHFGLTGDGQIYFTNRVDTALFYGEISGTSISYAMTARPRIIKWGWPYDAMVSTDDQSRIGYHSDAENGILTIRFENMMLWDEISTEAYRWSYDVILYREGKISVQFRSLALPDASSANQFGFAFALKGEAEASALYASDWTGNTSEAATCLRMDAITPPEPGAAMSFNYPLDCVPPSDVEARLKITGNLSTSFSGSVFVEGACDGALVLLSTTETIEEGPEDGRAYVAGTFWSAGDSISGCPVLIYGTDTTVDLEDLSPAMSYYLLVYPYNDRCLGGPLYGNPIVLDFATSMAPPTVELLETGEDFVRFAVTGNEGNDILVGMSTYDYGAPDRMIAISGRAYVPGDTLFYSSEPVSAHSVPYLMEAVYSGPVENGEFRMEGLEPGRPYYFYFWTESSENQYTSEYAPASAYTIGTTPVEFGFATDRVREDALDIFAPAGWSSSEDLPVDFYAGISAIGGLVGGGSAYTDDHLRSFMGSLIAPLGSSMAEGDMISPVFEASYSALDVTYRIQMASSGMLGNSLAPLASGDTISIWYKEVEDTDWRQAAFITNLTFDYEDDNFATLRLTIPEVEAGAKMQLRFLIKAVPGGMMSGKVFSLNRVLVEPALPCSYPVDLRVDDSLTTHRALAVEWTDENRPAASVIYRYRESGTEEWSSWLLGENTGCVITPLPANTLYEVGVRAVCSQTDSSLVKVVEGSTLHSLPFEADLTGFESVPDGFTTQYGELNGESPVVFSPSTGTNGWHAGCATSNGHVSIGARVSGGNMWLSFPPLCMEDQAAPAEYTFLCQAYYQDFNTKEISVLDSTPAQIFVLVSQDGDFTVSDIVDTLDVEDFGLDYTRYVLDLSGHTRQLHVALMVSNPMPDYTVDEYAYFVIDSLRARYTEGTPCLPVEGIRQYGLTAYGVTLEWTGYSMEYGIYYTNQDSGESDTVYTDQTRYVLEGLEPGSLYTYHIQPFCEEGHRSPGELSREGFFTTGSICSVPEDFQVIGTTWQSVTIVARSGSDKIVHVWEPGTVGSFLEVQPDTLTITGLNYTTEYNIAVRAYCAPGDSSLWTDTLSFTTSAPCCDAPTGLNAVVSATEADLSWTPGAENDYFWLMYRESVEAVFDTINVYLTEYTLSELEPNTAYVWQLQAICDERLASAPASSEFTTEPQDTENDALGGLSVFAKEGRITVWNPGNRVIDHVEVFDLNGRRLYSSKIGTSGNILLPVVQTESSMVLVRLFSRMETGVYKVVLM